MLLRYPAEQNSMKMASGALLIILDLCYLLAYPNQFQNRPHRITRRTFVGENSM